nr:MAG TPA: hypothetical protein [Caudoviricetes sp.]
MIKYTFIVIKKDLTIVLQTLRKIFSIFAR